MIAGPENSKFASERQRMVSHDLKGRGITEAGVLSAMNRLPREEFYRHFASLYRQNDIGPYYDLVQSGKMTIQDCKRGKAMLDAAADWEQYIDKDPILGERSTSRGVGDSLTYR